MSLLSHIYRGAKQAVSEYFAPLEEDWPKREVLILGTNLGTGLLTLKLAGMASHTSSEKLQWTKSLFPYVSATSLMAFSGAVARRGRETAELGLYLAVSYFILPDSSEKGWEKNASTISELGVPLLLFTSTLLTRYYRAL